MNFSLCLSVCLYIIILVAVNSLLLHVSCVADSLLYRILINLSVMIWILFQFIGSRWSSSLVDADLNQFKFMSYWFHAPRWRLINYYRPAFGYFFCGAIWWTPQKSTMSMILDVESARVAHICSNYFCRNDYNNCNNQEACCNGNIVSDVHRMVFGFLGLCFGYEFRFLVSGFNFGSIWGENLQLNEIRSSKTASG